MRLAIDNALRDRDEAVAEETRIYRDQLIYLVTRTSLNAKPQADGLLLFSQLQRIFGEDATVQLHNPKTGEAWSHGTTPTDDAIKMVIQEGVYTGWTVLLDRVVDLPEYIREAKRNAWPAPAPGPAASPSSPRSSGSRCTAGCRSTISAATSSPPSRTR